MLFFVAIKQDSLHRSNLLSNCPYSSGYIIMTETDLLKLTLFQF